MDHAEFFAGRRVRTLSALAVLFLAWTMVTGSRCQAQGPPPFVVTAQTTITAYPPTPTSGTTPNAVLEGAGFGQLAVNKFGDLFVGGYNSNTVVEFPAATMSEYNAATATVPYNIVYISEGGKYDGGGHTGAVAVDPNGNLIVSEVFSAVITMIPYINGAYTEFTNPVSGSSYSGSNPPNPPVCTGTINNGVVTLTSTGACSYDFPFYYYTPAITTLGGSSTNSPTGGYYQVADLTFDPAGNSFMATFGDSNGDTNVYECSEACNYAGAPPVQVYEFADPVTPTNKDQNYIDSIAVDAADDIFIANNSNTVWEVVAGTPGAQTVLPITGFIDAQGVAFDSSGNLYVTDNGTSGSGGTVNGGIYEIPLESGALNPKDMFMVFPLDTVSYCPGPNSTTVPCSYVGYASPWNISDIGVAVDQHGNIFQTVDYNTIYKYSVNNATLPATAIGATSAPVTLTVTFNGSVTLQSSSIATAGAASAEFSVISTGTGAGTCVTGTANANHSSCTINVQFTPAEPGLRTAILTVTDSAGVSVPVYLSGTGTGQAITVDPGTLTALGSGLVSPTATAVDGAGNVFVADAGANAVLEYPLGAGSGVKVGSGLKAPAGVATDAAGNLYISDTGNNRVVMVPNSGGVLNTASQSTLLTGLSSPRQLAVDSNGTLYVPEEGKNDVVAYETRGAMASSGLTTTQPIPNLNGPTAVAVDSNDDLYIADTGNNRVVLFIDGYIVNVGSNLDAPTGVAIDGSDSVIIADNGHGRILRVPTENGIPTGSDQTVVLSSIVSPYAVALDQFGNLYATDSANAAAYSVNRISGTIVFGQVNDTTSSAGQTAVLADSGQVGLTLGSPLFPALASGTPFTIGPGSSEGCASGATVLPGYGCQLEAYFTPALGVIGLQSYTVDFTTGAQNTASPSLTLNGQAVNEIPSAITLVQTVPTGNASYGSPVTIQATVTPAAGTGATAIPTGTVQFTVDGNNSGQPQTLDSTGSVSYVLSGLTGGTHMVAASYQGPGPYAPVSSSTLDVIIVPDSSATTLQVIGYAVNPLTAEPGNSSNSGDTVTMIATIAPSVSGSLSGTVVFSSGGTPLGPPATVVGVTTNSVTTYTAELITTGPTALTAGTYNIVASFQGNSNYTASASAATQLIVTPPTFTLATSAPSVTSSAKNPGSTTITVTSESAFTGAVNLACSGLPTNATCQFVPDVLLLAQCQGIDSNGNPCFVAPFGGEAVIPPLQTTLTVLVNQAPIVTPTGIPWWGGLLLGLSLFGLASNRKARQRLAMQCAAGCLLIASLTGLSACGGVTTFKTPTGTSTVTVTATATPTGSLTGANNVSQSFTFNLTVQ